MPRLSALLAASSLALAAACGGERKELADRFATAEQPDSLPVLQTKDAFRYPAALYEQQVQGNVVLRLFIDTTGAVRTDSTVVVQSSGYSALDSAAVRGSQELRFTPAQRDGHPMAVSILLPVFYRHPEAPPLPGDDTILPRAVLPDTGIAASRAPSVPRAP